MVWTYSSQERGRKGRDGEAGGAGAPTSARHSKARGGSGEEGGGAFYIKGRGFLSRIRGERTPVQDLRTIQLFVINVLSLQNVYIVCISQSMQWHHLYLG